jgi:hypothetical protein
VSARKAMEARSSAADEAADPERLETRAARAASPASSASSSTPSTRASGCASSWPARSASASGSPPLPRGRRGRGDLLREDFATIEDVERQLAVYREDLEREFRFRLADVEKVLTEIENRGLEFFDDTVRLARVFDLINRERIKGEYERRCWPTRRARSSAGCRS